MLVQSVNTMRDWTTAIVVFTSGPYDIKTESLDNANQECSLVNWSLWVMSHYTTLYKQRKHTHDFLGCLYF